MEDEDWKVGWLKARGMSEEDVSKISNYYDEIFGQPSSPRDHAHPPRQPMDVVEFVARFMPGQTPTEEQEQAIEMFLEGRNESTLWTSGRQGGKTTLRDALRMFLEWEGEWEARGRSIEEVVAATSVELPEGAPWMTVRTVAEFDKILYELWCRKESQSRPHYMRPTTDDLFRLGVPRPHGPIY